MKRSTLKLVIRCETIRTLTQLDLALAVGGNPNAQLAGTEGAGTGCPFIRAVDTGDAGTGCPFVRAVDTGGPATGCPNVTA